jgi:2-polyprenyl-3-methyl-5-hydroxy-6-metoxy-1,4-benzoquinol methylase
MPGFGHGPVRAGKDLLHLRCHLGLDTLAWARQRARVTGADFSERALEQARLLAAETGLDGRFVVSNVADLPANPRATSTWSSPRSGR